LKSLVADKSVSAFISACTFGQQIRLGRKWNFYVEGSSIKQSADM